MKTESRFASVFAPLEELKSTGAPKRPERQRGKGKGAPQVMEPVLVASGATAGTVSRGPGRPRGKRSDPEFLQTTAHLRRKTHHQVKLALLSDGERQEFSELVEELLSGWLKARSR